MIGVYDHVVFQDTSDEYLDGCTGVVVGYAPQTDDPENYILVLFDIPPRGFFPAIVIAEACLQKIGIVQANFFNRSQTPAKLEN